MSNHKKLAAIALLVVLVASLFAGCNNNSKDAAQTATQSPSTNTPETNATTPLPDPVTLTFGTYHAPTDSIDNFDQTAVGKAIKQQLNITLKIRGSQNPDQDFVADVAANNLPDIFAVYAVSDNPQIADLTAKAAKEGMLADLTELIKKDAPVISDVLKPERMPVYTQQVVFNPDFAGKTYLLPSNYSTKEPYLSGFGLYLRGDIAKSLKVDTAKIQTADDLYNLAKSIKAGGFKDINGKAVYPIGMIGAWPQNLYVLFREFDFGKSGFAVKDGKIKSFIESDNIWNQIVFTRKLISEGLMDPESFSHTYQIGSEKVAQGRNAIMPFYSVAIVPDWTQPMKGLIAAHPEMEYVGLAPMKDFQGSTDSVINKGMEAPVILGVSKKANTEAAIRLLNWLNSKEGKAISFYGEKDKQWFWNDKGFAQMKDETFKELNATEDSAYKKKYGAGVLQVASVLSGYSDDKYDIFGGDTRNSSYQNNPKLTDKNMEYVKQTMPNIVIKNQFDISGLLANFQGKDKLQPILSQLNDTLARCYLVKSEAEAKKILDGYRDTLNKNGYGDYIQFLQQEYDKDPNKYIVSSGNL